MEEMASERIEAIGRANVEADAAAAASMCKEADRLLAEHRDRTAQLQEEMNVRQIMVDIAACDGFCCQKICRYLPGGVRVACAIGVFLRQAKEEPVSCTSAV